MIQELCLIPKPIIDRILLNTPDNVSILKSEKKIISNNTIDFRNEIEFFFNVRQKRLKALDAYSWILKNVPGFEITPEGNVITPLKNINILHFLRDIYSGIKTFPKNKLDLYKIWISLIDFPNKFIDNDKIKDFVFSNIKTISYPVKRKLPFHHMETPNAPKKEKTELLINKHDANTSIPNTEAISDDNGNIEDDDGDNTSPVTIPEFRKYIKEIKSRTPLPSPRKTRSRSKQGFGYIFPPKKSRHTSLNNKHELSKWIKY